MTEDEIITALHKACIEISCIDNIHIRELFTILFAKDFDIDYRVLKGAVEKELKRRILDYKRRCGDA